jgi:predicted nucleic acid-binding protein
MAEQPTGPRLVVDTSPLVVLSKVGRVDLLRDVAGTLVVASAVADEIRAGPPNDPARVALESGRFGKPITVDLLPTVVEWGLGAGESAVLSLAAISSAVAVMDDREARRAAHALGVPVVGTLGIVLQAARDGRVESPATLVQALRDVGLRLDERAVAYAFQAILGEPWPGN